MFFATIRFKFLAFLSFFAAKTLKMNISTSVWSAQHPHAGWNIQHLWLFKGYLFDDVTQRDVFTIQGQTSDDVTEGENEVKITGSLFTNIRNVLQWGSENWPFENQTFWRSVFEWLSHVTWRTIWILDILYHEQAFFISVFRPPFEYRTIGGY